MIETENLRSQAAPLVACAPLRHDGVGRALRSAFAAPAPSDLPIELANCLRRLG